MGTYTQVGAKQQDDDLANKAKPPSEDDRALDLVLVLEPGDEARLAALIKTHPQLKDRIIQEATEQLGSQFVAKALALGSAAGPAPGAADRASARDLMAPEDDGSAPAKQDGKGDNLMDPSLEGPAPAKADRDAARDLMAPTDDVKGPAPSQGDRDAARDLMAPTDDVKPGKADGKGDNLLDPSFEEVKGPPPTKEERQEVRELLEPTFDEAKGPAPSAAERADALDLLDPSTDAKAEPKQETGWIDRAREYNKQHDTLVAEFVQYTVGCCMDASRPELDPEKVAQWQAEHGVPPDGRCGPATVAAAKKEALRPKHGDKTDADGEKKPGDDAPAALV